MGRVWGRPMTSGKKQAGAPDDPPGSWPKHPGTDLQRNVGKDHRPAGAGSNLQRPSGISGGHEIWWCPSTAVMDKWATMDTIGSSFRPWLSCQGICLLNRHQTGNTDSVQPVILLPVQRKVRRLSSLVKLICCGIPPTEPHHSS